MEPKLRTALQMTINDYYAVGKEISHHTTTPTRGLQLFAVKEALDQVLQHFMNAEYIECADGQWRIKTIVMESIKKKEPQQ